MAISIIISLTIQKKLNNEYSVSLSLANIGIIYRSIGEPARAANYFKQAEIISGTIGALDQQSQFNEELAVCYEELNMHELALVHYKKFVTLKDSIFNEQKSKDIGKLEARHEFEMAETERKREEAERAKQEEADKSRRDNLQYSGILIFLVLIFADVFALGRIYMPIRLAEGLIFFSFLLFFEFTLVLLDPYIEQYSSGAPAIKLAFNALLAGLIFPLHSFFETKLKRRLVKNS